MKLKNRGRLVWAAMLIGLILSAFVGANRAQADHAIWRVSAMSTQSQTTQVGTTFAENFSVRISCWNVDRCPASRANVSITFKASSSGGASGTFTNGTNTVVVQTDSSGIATAPAFTANSTTGSYSVDARAAEEHPESATPNFFFLTNSANAANAAASISTGDGSNQSKMINTTFVTRFNAIVFNGSNQLLPGITVTFTAPDTGASGTFQNTGTYTTTAITGPTGVAVASAFTANGTAGSYFVTATVSGSQTVTGEELSTTFAVRNTLSDVLGVPDTVSASAGNLQGVGIMTTLPTNMQVVVLDGNLDYVSGATVVFSVPSSGPSGTFGNGTTTYTTTSGSTGLATASAFTTNDQVGQIQVHVVATKNGVSAETNLGIINGKVETTTTLTKSPTGDSVYGQPVVLSATVRPVRGAYVPTGPVTFKRAGVAVSGCSNVSPSGGVATCTIRPLDNTDESTWLSVGPHSFTAEYLGDAVSVASTSTSVSHSVNKANTTVDLVTSHPTFVLRGDTVTFTATISPVAPGRGAPVGSVTFTSSDGTVLNGGAPVVVVNGIAEVSTNALLSGTHTITAVYSGGTNFNGSNDTLSQNVYTIPEVTQDPLNLLVLVGQPASFTAAATGVPTPSVIWQVSTDGGNTFENIPGATNATYSFTATGDDDQNQYRAVFTNPAGSDTSSAATLTVRQPPSFTSASSTTFTVGIAGSFTVTATGILEPAVSLTSGSLPSGVTFDDLTGVLSGTPAVGTGGTYSLVFAATNGTAPDASQTFTLSVNEAPVITSDDTTTFIAGGFNSFTVTASGHPASTFSSIGTLPEGVSFDNGLISGTPTEIGEFELALTAANGVSPDAAQTFTLVVERSNQAPLLLSVTPDNGVTGDKLVISVSGGSGTGALTFNLGTSTACELGAGADDGKLLITAGVGTCEITANKAESGFYTAAVSNTVVVTVGKAPVATSVQDVTGTFGGTVELSATLTSNGTPLEGVNVSFVVNGASAGTATTNASGVATLSGVSLTGINAGSYPGGVTTSYAGDDDYQSGSGSANLTVDKAAGSVTITNIPSPAYIGEGFTPEITAPGDGETSVTSLSAGICTINGDDVEFVAEGTCELQASLSEGTNHTAATGTTQSFAVVPPPVLALSTLTSGYNGWITATLTEFAPNQTVTLTWDDELALGTATTDGEGSAQIEFRTPLDVFGPHTVRASDGAGGASATLSITTRIKLTETEGPVGTVLRVYLYGYAAGDQVTIRFYSATGKSAQVLATLTIADNGRASALVTVPKTTVMGPRRVTGIVLGTGRTAETTFTVTTGSASTSIEVAAIYPWRSIRN